MVTPEEVRKLAAAALPGMVDRSNARSLAFEVGGKGVAWSLLERSAPRRPREPVLEVLAVRCDIARKEMLMEAAPEVFFQTDHYRGYPAVLVRLEAVEAEELSGLLAMAPAAVKVKK